MKSDRKLAEYIHGEYFGRMDADINVFSVEFLRLLREEINEELRLRRREKMAK